MNFRGGSQNSPTKSVVKSDLSDDSCVNPSFVMGKKSNLYENIFKREGHPLFNPFGRSGCRVKLEKQVFHLAQLDSDAVNVRFDNQKKYQDKDTGEWRDSYSFGSFRHVDDLIEWMKNDIRGRIADEVMPERGRVPFDFDRTKGKPVDKNHLKQVVENSVKDILKPFITREKDQGKEIEFIWMFYNVERDDKVFSTHLILRNVYFDRNLGLSGEVIAKALKTAMIPFGYDDMVDTGIYSKNHTVRIAYAEKREYPGYWFVPENVSVENIRDTFMSCVSDNKMIWPVVTIPKSEIKKREAVECPLEETELNEKLMQAYELLEDKDDWIVKKKTNKIDLVHKKPKYDCCVCGKKDANRDHSLQWYAGHIVRNCYHNTPGKKPITVIKGEPTENEMEWSPEEKSKWSEQMKVSSLNLIKPITDPKKYNQEVNIQFLSDLDQRTIDSIFKEKGSIISSYMGGGKTGLIVKVIESFDNPSVLYLSGRNSFASNVWKRLSHLEFITHIGFKAKDHPKDGALKVIFSLESLLKLKGRHFDIIIIDECEGIWNQLLSPTLGGKEQAIYDELQRMIWGAEKVIAMDAFVRESTFDVMHQLIGKEHVISTINSFVTKKKQVILYDYEKKFTSRILESIRRGKKLVIPTSSKKFGRKLEKLLETHFPNLEVNFIHSGMNDKTIGKKIGKNEMMDDASTSWKKFDVIIYTPTILNGVSVHLPDHFDELFCFASSKSVVPRNLLQMWGRCRLFNSDDIHLHIEELNVFERLELKYENILKSQTVFDKFKRESYANYKTIPEFAKIAISRTIHERNVSEKYFKDVLLHYITDVLHYDVSVNKEKVDMELPEVSIDVEMDKVDLTKIGPKIINVLNNRATESGKTDIEVFKTFEKLPVHINKKTYDYRKEPLFEELHKLALKRPDVLNNLYMWNRYRNSLEDNHENLMKEDLDSFLRAKWFDKMIDILGFDKMLGETGPIITENLWYLADHPDLLNIRKAFGIISTSKELNQVSRTVKEVFNKFGAIEFSPRRKDNKVVGYQIIVSKILCLYQHR